MHAGLFGKDGFRARGAYQKKAQGTMIIPDFAGGLGNQLFQLAFAFSLSRRLGEPLAILKGKWLIGYNGAQGSSPAKYWDTIYGKIDKVDELGEAADLKVIKETVWSFDAGLLDAGRYQPGNYLTSGYFQSGRYFAGLEGELRALLEPAGGWRSLVPARWEKLVAGLSEDDCFIGVRRGDYLKNRGIHCLCGSDYYRKALDAMGSCRRYYVMSDDLAWCRKHFAEFEGVTGKEFIYIDESDDLAAFAIMTQFSRYIIGNSSFNWWGSFLSVCERPRVVAPDKWIDVGADYRSIYRDGMIVVEREVDYVT